MGLGPLSESLVSKTAKLDNTIQGKGPARGETAPGIELYLFSVCGFRLKVEKKS